MKKLFSLIALLCLCVSGAWAAVTSYTWDFTNTTTWTTAKVSTGSAVTLNPSGATPGAGEYGVTFNFTENEGGQVKQNNASKSVYGTYLWFFKSGSASAENVAITVPAGFQVTFDVFATSTRLIKYTIDGANETSLSSDVLVYDNTTANPVIITLWANNPINSSGNSNNAIKRITLKDYTNADKYTCTLNAVATINGIKTTIKSASYPNLPEEKDYTVSSWKVISYGGKYYEQENSATMADFSKTYTMGNTNEVREINYVLAEDIEYFAEGEDIGNSKQDASSIISSGGQHTSYYKGSKETSALTGGTYIVEFITRGRAANQAFIVYASDGSTELYKIARNAYNDNTLNTTSDIYVSNGSTIKVGVGSSENSSSIDYFLVRKVSNYEIVGKRDFTTAENAAHSADVTLAPGETLKYTFRNHGQDYGKNWRIFVKEDETVKSVTRADSWDEISAAATKVAYQVSKDNGETKVALDWSEYQADMANATVEATLTYGVDGTLAIVTESKGDANGYIYYVDQDVAGLNGNLTINLSVNNSWLEIISTEKSTSCTISAAGYTTFSSTSNIDADAITGGKAYVINAFNAENVVLTPATGIVPANTGMIIAGEGGAPASAGTVTIPVSTADATFDTSNNLLVACATATTVQAAAAGKKNYVLAYDAADAANTIGFYYIGATSATVAAGKAYLTVDEATPAKMFRFTTGNTTGIKAVSNEMTANKATKRIMNGQLVIEKAGKMYNAAGAQMK